MALSLNCLLAKYCKYGLYEVFNEMVVNRSLHNVVITPIQPESRKLHDNRVLTFIKTKSLKRIICQVVKAGFIFLLGF